MKLVAKTLCVAGLAVQPVTQASAIIMRHDVDRSRYLALGEQHRQTLVMLGLRSKDDGASLLYNGMGTLIAPRWVLTAAHAAEAMKVPAEGQPDPYFVFVKGRGYRVEKIYTHPGWNESGEGAANDIALIKLATPVREAQPACLYEGTTELDQTVTVVGAGYPGDGVQGPTVPDGALLGGTVRVDTVNALDIRWKFRPPDDPRTTPLEGISGPGDSGGPGFLVVKGRTCVAGVSSSQAYEIDPTKPDPGAMKQGRYGAIEIYTRVSAFVPWIRSIIAKG